MPNLRRGRDALIPVEDFVRFCERTIAGMVEAARRLDDTAINAVPDMLPGANSPFALVNHALGALEWWTGHMVAGHPSTRDRAAEFMASGTVADLVASADAAAVRIRALAPDLAAARIIMGTPRTSKPLVGDWTIGACLLHAYEELAQHLGHLELTVDLLDGPTSDATER